MDDPKALVINVGTMVLNFLEAHPWLLITLIAHGAILGAVAYLILLERKTASWVQDRIGPNRVGLGFGIIPFLKDMKMWGLGQPLADGVKFILKEDYQPKGVDKILFTAAPMMMIIVVIASIAVLPWGGIKRTTRDVDLGMVADVKDPMAAAEANLPIGYKIKTPTTITDEEVKEADGSYMMHKVAHLDYTYAFQTTSLNIGVLYILAVLSLAVYGVVIGGWASNNKYSFLGGLRATANMISYEIPLGLAVLCVALVFGTLNLEDIVNKQAAGFWCWNVWTQPYAFILFLICIHAEANRAPFDLAEAEQELVGGYHTEYSAMRFALFFLGEYAGMVTTSVVCVALFFGGWHLPFVENFIAWVINELTGAGAYSNGVETNSLVICIIRSLIIFGKTLVVVFIFMWVRWSLPRFRFDQLMILAWRGLIPVSLALLMGTALAVYFVGGAAGPDETVSLFSKTGMSLAIVNVAMIVLSIIIGANLPSLNTNRKMKVPNSRYAKTPLPGGAVARA